MTAHASPSGTFDSPVSLYELRERYGSSEGDTLDPTLVGPSDKMGFEKIRDQGAIGWQGANIAMLSFAAGDTVGEATKWQSTYLMINLGDPVAHIDTTLP